MTSSNCQNPNYQLFQTTKNCNKFCLKKHAQFFRLTALRPFHTPLFTRKYHDPYNTTQDQRKLINKAMKEIRQWHHLNMELVLPQIKPTYDIDIESQKEKIVENVPKPVRDYFREFCTTQHFTMYMEDLLKTFHERKETEENFFDQFDDKIKNLESERMGYLDLIDELQVLKV